MTLDYKFFDTFIVLDPSTMIFDVLTFQPSHAVLNLSQFFIRINWLILDEMGLIIFHINESSLIPSLLKQLY